MSAEAFANHFTVLREGAGQLGLALSAHQLSQFARFRDLLLDWNTRINLTAVTDPAEVEVRHFLDSLTCLEALPASLRERRVRLLDIGSGAGFPGLALAIACPRWEITSLDSTSKKIRFQEEVIADLGLENARAIAGRAEEFGRQREWRGRYDVVTARAVAALPTLLEFCCPFARVGGYVVMPKKGDLAEEIETGSRAAAALGVRLLAPVAVSLPPLNDGRLLLVARQDRPCPSQYPRAAGAPVKRPLGMTSGGGRPEPQSGSSRK